MAASRWQLKRNDEICPVCDEDFEDRLDEKIIVQGKCYHRVCYKVDTVEPTRVDVDVLNAETCAMCGTAIIKGDESVVQQGRAVHKQCFNHTTKFCKCGHKNNPSALFCQKCGIKFAV